MITFSLRKPERDETVLKWFPHFIMRIFRDSFGFGRGSVLGSTRPMTKMKMAGKAA